MKIIFSDKAPAAIGPYSHAIEANNTIYISGQLPIDGDKGTMPTTAKAQTEQVLKNVKHILEAGGYQSSKVVKTTVYLANMSDFAAMNEVYTSFFGDHKPARSCFQVAKLPKDALVEIDAIAVK